MADKVEKLVRGLYAWLGEPVTETFEAAMRAWWAENAEKREPHPKADPQSFGLDLDEIRPRFAHYVDTYLRSAHVD